MGRDAMTPMMRQFYDLKQKHPDAVLLFRCGDFYETYGSDAVLAAKVLGITLTRRNNSGDNSEMAGFPYHALDTYLPRLIRSGHRVAICDQLEDPKKTKTLVKRGITELVTPGVTMSDNVLQTRENNFLASVHFGKASCGVAFLDISTGEFLTAQGTPDYVEKLITSFAPKEVLRERGRREQFERHFGSKLCIYELDDWVFTSSTATKRLLRHFDVATLKGFGIDHLSDGIVAAGAILEYLELTQHTQLGHITTLSRIEEERYVRLDRFTVRSLELVSPMTEDGRSLVSVLDRTQTPLGARLLRRWVLFPERDVRRIGRRQDMVEHLVGNLDAQCTMEKALRQVGDLERVASRVAVGRVGPRDLQHLMTAMDAVGPLREALVGADCEPLRSIAEQINPCQTIVERLRRELSADLPLQLKAGGVIANGVSQELDHLREVAHGGKHYLLKIQEREQQNTGISNLKVGFNNVFGYYLEVRNTSKDLVPPTWIRKQTLAQAERYITEELKEYENTILGAEDKIAQLEAQLFAELVAAVGEYVQPLQLNARLLAELDCILSFAIVAQENHYSRPTVDDSLVLDIKGGRHPVIEKSLAAGEAYVPNDVRLDADDQQIILVTGPNMAGKSALLRQTAIIALMAHMGSFVPAREARIGVVDKIFTRVGASDNISMGESTFMVEMTEAANILRGVTSRSLVLFDELGRGTSTYDGLSIAWSIVEHLHERSTARARTLFATHYHELAALEERLKRVKNYNVSVSEQGGKVVFLRKLMRGASPRSFGISVAKLAGMPQEVTRRAEEVLQQLEASNKSEVSGNISDGPTDAMQLSLFTLPDDELARLRDELLATDLNTITPIAALNKLHEIRQLLGGQ